MNILITGAWQCSDSELEQIKAMGHEIVFMQYEKEKLPCEFSWIEGIICNGLFLYHKIENFTNLKYIQLTSAGFDRVPMDYVQEHGIEIHNARGVYSVPMGEFAICGVLQLYKQSRFFYENQKSHKWEKHRGLLELSGKTVCIVGCGSVGTECAKRFKAFGCEIIGIDAFPHDDENYSKMLDLIRLKEIISIADVIILTVPLTDETYHLINAEIFAVMKSSVIFVNIARGAVIDTTAMIQALPQIGGAVLDVFEEEPLSSDSPLWKMENVILTPHNSFVSEANKKRLYELIIKNLRVGK